MPSRRSARYQPKDEFQRGVLEYAGASAALEELEKAGVNPDRTFAWLSFISQLAGRKRRTKPIRIAGLPMHRFRRLPKRVQGWARQIEKVNTGMQENRVTREFQKLIGLRILPDPELDSSSKPNSRSLIETFHSLPNLLRAYALYLQAMGGFYRGGMKIGKWRIEEVRFNFVDFVKSETGKPHYRAISHLLTAAYLAVGLSEEEDPHNLEMAYSRYLERSA